jgi:hypothetical protein
MEAGKRRVGGEVTQRIAKPLINPRPRKIYPPKWYHDKPGTAGERDTHGRRYG